MAKNKNKLKGKLQLQGAKYMLWDQISAEVDNFWEYVNYIEDKGDLIDSTYKKMNFYNRDSLINLKVPYNY